MVAAQQGEQPFGAHVEWPSVCRNSRGSERVRQHDGLPTGIG